MDYFKSLSSAASSVLSSAKSGPIPNYTIGQEQTDSRSQSIWTVYSATKRDDGSACTVLAFDTSNQYNAHRANLLPLAKNAARRLRTTRHPHVLRLLDSAETNTAVYIAVEKATPLPKVLAQTDAQRSTPQRQNWIVWGLSSVMSAVKFLNNEAASTHGNLRPDSIFLSSSGEWKLAGFETLTAHAEAPNGLLYTHASLLPEASHYAPPEVKQNGWTILSSMDSTLLDSYALALVALEAFNGPLPPQSSSAIPQRGHAPQAIYSMLRRMLVPNAKNRLTVAKVLEAGEADGGFFKENTLVKVARGLDGFLLATENEKADILAVLKDKPDSFNPEFLTYKVLPALLGALDHTPPPGTIASTSMQPSNLLPLVLRLSQPLPQEEWTKSMVASLIKAFASPDRLTRMALLENLTLYVDRLENKTVTDKIWPNLISGFNDSAAPIREETLKAVLTLAPKLSDRILNNELLRHLARTQVDPEPGIRTNTTVLLGRLAPKLSLSTRKKVLIPAFSRSLKDTFVHARVAGLTALMATGESYDHDDAAKQVLPAIVPCLVDKEKLVRDQADRAVQMFMECVREGVKGMPDTVLLPDQTAGINGAATTSTSAGGAAAALAGWAMSSAFSSFSAGGDRKEAQVSAMSQTTLDGRATPTTPALATPASASFGSPRISTSSSASSLAPVSSSTRAYRDALDYDLDEDAKPESKPAAPALERDLMDVNDDSADWSSFEIGQPKKKPTAVGRTKMKVAARRAPGAAAAAAAAPKRTTLALAATLDASRVVSRSSLKPVLPAEDDGDAWGDAWEDGAGAGAGSSMAASQELTANAFQTPVPEELSIATPPPEPETKTEEAVQESWAAFDEEEEEEEEGDEVAKAAEEAAPVAAAKVLSKEEKKAELERKRQERRERLAQLKEEKEKARMKAMNGSV